MRSASHHEVASPALDAGRLIRHATDLTGLTAFGDERLFGRLDGLIRCITSDVAFNATGMRGFGDQLVRILVNRLRFQEDLRKHPEILDEDVSDPIVIFGLPRSGTTKTQRMMAAAPNVLRPYLWQMLNPAPFPDAAPGQPDPRIAAAGATDHLSEESAQLQAAHEMTGDAVEEDWILFEQTLNDVYFFIHSPSPALVEQMMARPEDDDENYAYVRTLFQYLQWQHGGKRGRPWIMKNNNHIGHLDALLRYFPAATLIHLHRDPKISIPSWAKLELAIFQTRLDAPDPALVGRCCLSWAELSLQRYLEARDRLQLDDRIIDVAYETIRDDPMPIVRAAYRRAGYPLTPEAESALRGWHDRNEQHKLGRHRYSLEEFGLSADRIDQCLDGYIRRFIAPHRTS